MAAKTSSRKRPWGVLLPPPWPLDAFAFLCELLHICGDESPVPDRLWSGHNSVLSWKEVRPEDRGTLFRRSKAVVAGAGDPWEQAAREVPELTTAFRRFRALCRDPESASATALTQACESVAQWAEAQSLLETAIHFAEAAAALSPDSAPLANTAARVCRAKGAGGRAEVWYERAVGLARGAGDIREYINAHLGFGALLLERRSFRAAQKTIRKAGARARQQGMRQQAAEAFHDAFAVAIVEGNPGRAAHYARRAVDAYPRHADRYPAFAYDLGYLLVCCGMYPEALRLLELAASRIRVPADHAVVLGALARAAAGTGDRELFDHAVGRVSRNINESSPAVAAALYNIGEGARLLGEWEAAATYAGRAAELARDGESQQVLWLAEELKRAASERRAAEPILRRTDRGTQHLSELADLVYSRLESWRGQTWRPRRGQAQ